MMVKVVEGKQIYSPVSVFENKDLNRCYYKPDIKSFFDDHEKNVKGKNTWERDQQTVQVRKQTLVIKKGKERAADKYGLPSNLEDFSTFNQSIIMGQVPNATAVYGPNQWRLLGRRIHPEAEKSPIQILAPVFREETLIGFEGIYVFDISQTYVYDERQAKLGAKEAANAKRQTVKRPPRSHNNGRNLAYEQQKNDYFLRKAMWDLQKACDRSVQHYLNQKAYQEMEREAGAEYV